MNLSQALKNIQIHHWSHMLAWLGGLSTVGLIFFEAKAFNNEQLIPFTLGTFLIGCGEWCSWKKKLISATETSYGLERRTGIVREHTIPGNLMTIIGLMIIAVGIWFVLKP